MYCLFWGEKRETHKQNSQEISGKCRDSPGIIPGQSRGNFVYVFSCLGTDITGRPGYRTMEMIGGSSASYLARTPCVPSFCTLFNRGGNRRAFRLPGAGGDHFHCTVEPSSGHIRCRLSIQLYFFWPPKNFRRGKGSRLVGGTRLVVFPRPNRPQFERATSRDPLSSRDALPLALPKEVQKGGRGPGRKGGGGSRLEGG